MRRDPGVAGQNAHVYALRRHLQVDPFTGSELQWGWVAAVHGTFSTTLYANAALGATSVELNAAPVVNDYLMIGTLAQPIRVTAVSGSAAPYTATLAQEIPAAQSSGAAVTRLKTLDVYPDGTQTLANEAYLITGVRALRGYWTGSTAPAVDDYVLMARKHFSTGRSDRVVVDALA